MQGDNVLIALVWSFHNINVYKNTIIYIITLLIIVYEFKTKTLICLESIA